MATLRIFSDLHLGHPASTIDRVGMLRPLFDGIDGIWFNGDTVETCSGLLATESLAALGELTRTLESLGIRWETLPGNHDPDRGGPALRELENGEVVVTHGDMCFRYGSPWSPWVPKIMDKLVEAEKELGGYAQADDLAARARLAQAYAHAFQPRPRKFTGSLGKLETIKHAAWPPTTPLAILNVWINGPEMVAKWMEQFTPAAKVLVMGHTHRPGLWFRRGKWILNTGAYHPFAKPRVVDYLPGRLEMRPVVRRGGEFHPGPLVRSLIRGENGWRRE